MAVTTNFNPGTIAESRARNIDSNVADEVVNYGKGLMYQGVGVADFDGTTEQEFAGIALESTKPGHDDEQYDAGEDVSTLRKGIVWVVVDEDSDGVEKGDNVALMPSGDFDVEKDGGGSTGDYALNIKNAEFKSDAAAGEVVKLEVNGPANVEEVQLA
ncbi:MAG: hypothetical protein R6V17_07405 [Halanaerobacter sp.]